MHHSQEIIGQILGPETCYADGVTSWIPQSVQVNTETVPHSPQVDIMIVHITSDRLFPYPLAVTYPVTIPRSFDSTQYNVRHLLINWNWIPKKKYMNTEDENYTGIQPSAWNKDTTLKLIFHQVAKKLSAFYVTRNFVRVFTKTICQSLPWST